LRYQFEDYALDIDRRELWCRDALVPLEPQVFDLLTYLVCNRDRVVTKEDLLTAVWNNRFVSESALTTRMNAVRTALGDNGQEQRIVRTLRSRGFRFVGDVREVHDHSGHQAPERLVLPDRPSIAVLPFANMSSDPDQDYFADGMVDDILTALSRVNWLFVIARQSSFCYKGRPVGVQQIGRELGVRYVVEGSVRKAGSRVRITAQLIEAETAAHLWADRHDGDLREIFTLQDEITERLVAGVETSVQAAEIKRARCKPTENLTAYDLYLRALPAYFGQTQVEYRRTQALLGKALEADPEYPEALGLLADSVAIGTLQGWQGTWAHGWEEACRLAERALAVGPEHSTCVVSAAYTFGVLAYRFEEALDLANRALLLHPNSVLVRNRVGTILGVCGETDKAIAHLEAARRMNPLDSKKAATATFATLSFTHYMAGRFEEALHAGRRALAFTPTSNSARKFVAMSLAQLGRVGEAQVEIAELIRRQPEASLAVFRQHGFRHKWMRELHLDGLRKAGLREE
jgi:adenylate cyclase